MTSVQQRINHCLIIANPTAGSTTPTLVRDITDQCAVGCRSVDTRMTGAAGEAAGFVAEALGGGPGARPELIVVVGGDGTVREAAEGLAQALGRWPAGDSTTAGAAESTRSGDSAALLMAPGGTGNSSYRAVWGARGWSDVFAAVLRGDARIRDIDLARVVERNRAVMLGASTGLIARVTAVATGLTDVPGRERYHRALAMVLADPESYIGRVYADGVEIHRGPTTMVSVGGGRHRAGVFEVLPRSVLDDGLLDVCVVAGALDDATRAELAPLVMTGAHLGHPAVTYAQARRITVERTDGAPLCFEYDGEVVADADAATTLQVVPAAVPVFAPLTTEAG